MGPTEILVSGGVAALLASLVGGGLKAFGVEVPALASVQRQVMLAVTGVVLLAGGLFLGSPRGGGTPTNAQPAPTTAPSSSSVPQAVPTAQPQPVAQAPARPEVPNIVDLPFPTARQFLIQNAWAPISMGSPMANDNLGIRVQEIFETGYGEAVSCSGSSLAPCLFRYRNPNGFVLEVVTRGEDLKTAVVDSARIVDCSAQPKPDPC